MGRVQRLVIVNPRLNRSKEKTANSLQSAAQVSSPLKRNKRDPHYKSRQSFKLNRTLLAPLAFKTHRIRTVVRKARRRKRSERQSLWANQLPTSLTQTQSKRKRVPQHHLDVARRAVAITSLVHIQMRTLRTILRGQNRSLPWVIYQHLLSHKRPRLQPYRAFKTSTIGTLTRWLMMRKRRNL